MAKFVFELEAVLTQRRAVERRRQLEVAAIERERGEIEEALRAIQARLRREKDELRAALDAGRAGAGVDLRGVRLQANASLHLISRGQQLVLRLAGTHHRLDAACLGLVDAAMRRKAVENLREKRREAWALEEKRGEAKVLDELAVMRAVQTGEAA